MKKLFVQRLFAVAFLLGVGSLAACAAGDIEETYDDDEDIGTAEQALSLGSTLGANVASGTTCGQYNGVTPTCAWSSASDRSFEWTAPYSGTFTFTTNGSNFNNVLIISSYSNATSQEPCRNANGGLGGESISKTMTAGQKIIITIDGFASLCGPYQLNIHPPACTIGGQTYQNGQLNPSNPCQKCNIAQSTTSWSNNDGHYVETGGGGYCKYNTCIAGGCDGVAFCSTPGGACDGVCSGGTVVTACGGGPIE